MPYRWRTRLDVDESIVVIMNSLDKSSELPNWLTVTIRAAITDSDPEMSRYFYSELKKYAPKAMKYFEGSCGLD
jgi:hypothetical protein